MPNPIAQALYSYLCGQIQGGGPSREFFRLDDFEDSTYRDLLEILRAHAYELDGRPLWVRTSAPIQGYEDVSIEANKSATWYRNHIPKGHALILIFNRRTSDAQSLKDIFPITETALATDGLQYLIGAAFAKYQLNKVQLQVLISFIERLRRVVFQPQLRDLTDFLSAIDTSLAGNQIDSIEKAIAQNLPYLGLFRCYEIAEAIDGPRADRLLRDLYSAVRMGTELFDDRQRNELLARIEEAEFDNDSAFGGPTSHEKKRLLAQFLTEVLTNRQELLKVLHIDWQEVRAVLFKKNRKTRAEQLQELAQAVEKLFGSQGTIITDLPEFAQTALEDLASGHEPDGERLDRLATEYQDTLGKVLGNKLRRLISGKTHSHPDFIAGLTIVAVELLNPLQAEIKPGANFVVQAQTERLGEVKLKEAEALAAFRILYCGIESLIPSLTWELDDLWDLAEQHRDWRKEEDDSEDRQKLIKVDLPFRISLQDEHGQDLAFADLNWQYRSDSPGAATLANLEAELDILGNESNLRIPIYRGCAVSDDVSDIDLHRPRASLGAWYDVADDLRQVVRVQLTGRSSLESLATVDEAIGNMEQVWAAFVRQALTSGVLGASLDALLRAYDEVLSCATVRWQSGQEAANGFRALSQAWMVGPQTFDEWAVIPFLHPLKLHWWRERARRFGGFISALLDPLQADIVDEVRFRRQLTETYSSAGFPAVLALPIKDGWPEFFLPVDEADGYELYRRAAVANITYGLDSDLVTEAESEAMAQGAAELLARVIRDYIETYPFVRDGLEIYIVQCRNGALPGLLVEKLTKIARQRLWTVRVSIVIHTTDRGAPLFQRVSDWLKANEEFVERTAESYFPPITLKVLECEYEALYQRIEDIDLVVLPDVLAERGQSIEADSESEANQDVRLEGYLPVYNTSQEPFERGEYSRAFKLNPQPQPAMIRRFYNAQWSAKQRRAMPTGKTSTFQRVITLQDWEEELSQLHRAFNWVVCYDTAVDRFLLEDTFPNTVEVIRYSLGLGTQGQHNLTVSSSRKAQDIVVGRLKARLEELLPGTPGSFREEVARRLIDEAKQVSGDIVLRAAGPGTYLNELIGMVAAKYLTEQQLRTESEDALTTWIYLDDFGHWFEGQKPDLLYILISRTAEGGLSLRMEVLETKCISQTSFGVEGAGAERQTMRGVNRLFPAWKPGGEHLDAAYWYNQLYCATVGNVVLEHERQGLWELFRERLPTGIFTLDMSGHAWVFCHDGNIGLAPGKTHEEGAINFGAPDAPNCALIRHHWGRSGLRGALRELVENKWHLQTPPDIWSTVYDATQPSTAIFSSLDKDSPTEVPPELGSDPVSVGVHVSDYSKPEIRTEDSASQVSHQVDPTWLEAKGRDLERALRQYSIQVQPVDSEMADVGPSIIRFKVRLRPGEQISRLQRIANDLARELALTSVPLIDNVLGTNYVGIDLPRPGRETVDLLPFLQQLTPPPIGNLPIVLGQTPDGQTVIEDLSEFPHLLVAGATNSGKSVFLRNLVLCLISQYEPIDLRLLIIDPKRTDFSFFNDLPYLVKNQVVTDKEEARDLLLELVHGEMPRRQLAMAGRSLRIKDFNLRYPGEALPPVVAIIDEYAQLLSIMNKRERESFERDLMSLAAVARSTGIHLVLATQRPSADVVTGTLKANLPASIAFKVASSVNSRIVIDQNGAENLLGYGDMLFRRPSGDVLRLQAPFMDEVTLQTILEKFKRKREP